jgi:hypothetical protein
MAADLTTDRRGYMATTVITVFRDQDDAFFTWLAENTDGYFLNPVTVPSPGLMLHRATCPHFKGSWQGVLATRSPKFCAADRTDLQQCSPDAAPCKDCFH